MPRKLIFLYDRPERSRLDSYLVEVLQLTKGFEYLSRSQIKLWIKDGCVHVGDKVVSKSGTEIASGDQIVVEVPEISDELVPYDFDLDILFEDEVLIVINKPAGLMMHPGAGESVKTLANAIAPRVGIAGERPGIVHRLDKDTTGVVVVAKTLAAQTNLAAQFSERTAKRRYDALVMSTPRRANGVGLSDEGTIDAPIGRSATNRTQMAIDGIAARAAVTHWKVKERFQYGTWIEARLESGRTHQIRVHLNSIASPVIGDRTYGDFSALPKDLKRKSESFGKQALHAAELGFKHPISGDELLYESKVPDDFEKLLQSFRSWK